MGNTQKPNLGLASFFAGLSLVATIFILLLGKLHRVEAELERYKNAPADTVFIDKIDTLLYDNPQLIERYESEKEKVVIEVRRLKKQLAEALNMPVDTLEIHDTTTQLVYLPREYMVYKDTSYRAVVSGVEPRLDSLQIYQKTIKETITKTVKEPTRWGLGLQVGAGWNGKKVQPYVGVGVQYNIICW